MPAWLTILMRGGPAGIGCTQPAATSASWPCQWREAAGQPAEASFVHGHVGLELLGFGSPQRNGAQSGCSSAGGEGQRTQAARPIERRVAVRKSLGLTPISPQASRDRALTL